MHKYLLEMSEYEDIYDLHTIEDCLRIFDNLKQGMEKHRAEFVPVPPHHADFDHEVLKACSYTVNILAINRHRNKQKFISESMSRDKATQEFFDNSTPLSIPCDKCNVSTRVIDKNLHDQSDGSKKVSFMYECIKCRSKSILYADGSKWDYVPPVCPKCSATLSDKSKKVNQVLTITSKCTKCDYIESHIIDFEKNRLEREADERRKEFLFANYRSQSCFDEVGGQKAVADLDGMIQITKEWKEHEKKEKDPIFQQVKKLKKLKLNQLKDLVAKRISVDWYTDLQFSQPEMGKFVIVNFTATDTSDNRSKYDSENTLKKLLKVALECTNWRLMTEGIHCRLGIVSGRLKAYEQEDDLMELIKTTE